MTGPIRRSIPFFALFMCVGLDMSLIGPTLPNLAAQTGSSVGEIGLVFFLGALGVSIGTLVGGWALGRVPGRFVLGICEIASGSMLLAVPHVGWYGPLLALFVVKGVTGGVVGTSANTMLQWVHGEKAGPYVNALHFFFGLGAFASPFVLGLLLSAGAQYSVAFTLFGLLDVSVGFAVLLRLTSEHAPLPPAADAHAHGVRGNFVIPIMLAGMAFLFFYVSAEITFAGWIYTYAVTLGLTDAARAAYLTSLFWLAFTIGRLVSIPVAVRVSSAPVLVIAFTGCAAFLALLIILPRSEAVVWVCAAGVGLAMAPIWPSGYNLPVQSIRLTAGVGAVIMMGDSVGAMVLPGTMGLVMERAGAGAMTAMVLASIGAAAVAFGAILFFRARRKAALGAAVRSVSANPAPGS